MQAIRIMKSTDIDCLFGAAYAKLEARAMSRLKGKFSLTVAYKLSISIEDRISLSKLTSLWDGVM
jgi:hypothetical protein